MSTGGSLQTRFIVHYVFYTGSWLPIANRRCEQQVAEAAVLTDRDELINIFMISDTEAVVDLFNMSIV